MQHPNISREAGPDGEEHLYVSGGLAWRMFGLFALAYVISYAFRAINAVMAQPLVDELGLSAADLGLLASAYFLAFAVMQLPVGILLDRYGPRRTECSLLILAAVGALLFAVADNFAALWVGRALIGVGASACLMAALKAYSLYFRPHMQGSMSSYMLMAGSVGALTVTTPVEAAIPVLGWRGVFLLAAALTLLVALALWFGLPSLFKPQKTESWQQMAKGYREVFSHSHFWRVAPLALVVQGGFMAFQGLWVGPWFTEVAGVSNAQAAQNLFWISLTLMLGYLSVGVVTQRIAKAKGDEDKLMLIGLGLSMLVFGWQLFEGPQAGLAGWVVHALLMSSGIMTYASCNRVFPKRLTGRSSTALNLAVFIGAFSTQWGVGVGVDLFVGFGFSTEEALRISLALLLALMTFAWAWFARPGRKTSHLMA